ncbi:MAG TPA: hypothetical protein VIC85_20770 [Ktedonobacterales bacterium]|jgi:hypothetical protein
MNPDPASQPARPKRVTRKLAVSRGLDEAHYYRPGSVLAITLLGAPALVALAAAGVTYARSGRILIVVPFLLCAWLFTLPATWISLVTVRTTIGGIASRHPLSRWTELAWDDVRSATRRGPVLLIRSARGQRVRFAPLALRDGARLYRLVLMRLPAPALDPALREDARALLGEQVVPHPDGGLTGLVSARPQARWRAGVAGIGVVCAATTALAALTLPPAAALPIGGLALMALGLCALTFMWLLQRVTVSDRGIAVARAYGQRSLEIAWPEVQLLEHTPREGLLRLRGDRRLLCPGPTLLPPASRDGMRAFLHAYCVNRGIPVAKRRWLV